MKQLKMKYQREMERRMMQRQSKEDMYHMELKKSHQIETIKIKEQLQMERVTFQKDVEEILQIKESEMEDMKNLYNETKDAFQQYQVDAEMRQNIRSHVQQQEEMKLIQTKHKEEINQRSCQYKQHETELTDKMKQLHQLEISKLKERYEMQIEHERSRYQRFDIETKNRKETYGRNLSIRFKIIQGYDPRNK
jgi:hypothetical protein